MYTEAIQTPIYWLGNEQGNNLFIKREDLIPFSFGGNKARKAQLFFEEIDRGNFDCVVTYGSGSSNHCRVVANMAAARNIPCYIISPEEVSESTYNSELMECFGAQITTCPVNRVHDTIENKLDCLRVQNCKPYFIAGGGHGNLGTQAYVNCYEEICRYEKENDVHFDYIFHASGTGTTQAGLICGQLINCSKEKIVGISIARRNPRGCAVVVDSVKEYLREKKIAILDADVEKATVFLDDYILDGYGSCSNEICRTIDKVMVRYGIPLDMTYTGKAFTGMLEYIQREKIMDQKILFIHTGGTPLYFDYLNKQKRNKE